MKTTETELLKIVDLMFKEHELKMRDGFKELIRHIDVCIEKINDQKNKTT